MRKIYSIISLAAVSVLTTACSTMSNSNDIPNNPFSATTSYEMAQRDGLVNTVELAIDSVLAQAQGKIENSTILVASTQKLDSLNTPGTIGRTIGEVISSRLAQKGFPVVETKLRSNLVINDHGELLLSRDLRNIAAEHSSNTVITSSWSAGGSMVYVTIKAIRVSDGVVVGSKSITLPLDNNIREMIK